MASEMTIGNKNQGVQPPIKGGGVYEFRSVIKNLLFNLKIHYRKLFSLLLEEKGIKKSSFAIKGFKTLIFLYFHRPLPEINFNYFMDRIGQVERGNLKLSSSEKIPGQLGEILKNLRVFHAHSIKGPGKRSRRRGG